MENCPRSCPSRQMTVEELRMADVEEDCLPQSTVDNIYVWNMSIAQPLTMREYDVAVFDLERRVSQEFQKAGNEMRFQVQNGLKYCS